MKNWYIYLAVTVGGASVLGIEILGTRIIGPFYGVSLYLWTALIGVTLAALSLGYALGGHWADRGPRIERFGGLLVAAGIWIVLIPYLRFPALKIAEPLGLRVAVLCSAFVLFFPPLSLLGMVSPYAIRLKASAIDVVGRTAGNLYAVSTVASVLAAIFTGFFLIPNMGVSRLTFAIGVLLVVTGAIGLVSRRRATVAVPGIVVLFALGVLSLTVAPSLRTAPDEGLLAIENSTYAEIRVVDRNGLRYMLIDGGTHTIVEPGTWTSHFPYVDVLDITRDLFTKRGDLLLVGLGGGSVVKGFASAGWNIDVVEIDPVVTKVAQRYFGLGPSEARVFHMDGRQYFIQGDETFDLVILDAFGSSSIPFHLVTREAFELIRTHLEPDGVLAMNIEAIGWGDVLVRSLGVTLQEVFDHVLVLPIAEPPDRIGNLILLAAGRPLELVEELPLPSGRFGADYNRAHAWDNRFTPTPDGAPVLTDEFNPIDIWSERINLVARKDLHEYFGSDGLSW